MAAEQFIRLSSELEEPFLSRSDYDFVLNHWVERRAVDGMKRKQSERGWCEIVVRGLREGDHRGKIIRQGTGRLGSADARTLERLILESEKDPLMLLNRVGVAPWSILSTLEQIRDQKDGLDALLNALRSKVSKKSKSKSTKSKKSRESKTRTTARIRQIAKIVDPIEWWLRSEIDEKSFLPPMYRTATRLRAIADVLEQTRSTYPYDRKGRPYKDHFYRSVLALQIITEAGLNKALAQAGKPDAPLTISDRYLSIAVAQRAMYGIMTEILLASFPEWFKTEKGNIKDPKKTVERAYGEAIKITNPLED